MTDDTSPHFLTLPPEIREHIYRLLLNPDANRLFEQDEYTDYDYSKALVLFRLNHQIYYEARKIFRDLNVFVRIETPWPEAQSHVAFEGHTPILMKDERAKRFNGHSLNVTIDAPHSPIADADKEHFVILLDDLEKFSKTWYYADLSHPGLNRFLRLQLQLRDPYTPDWDDKRMPKWLQRQLLLPFGYVKNLHTVLITGDPKPLASIESELRQAQAVPHHSPEHCLRETTRLKADGNAELKAGNYKAAIAKYNEAWEAMHIIVKGRQRHVHADAFFGITLKEEPFNGKEGQAERLILRVQLVANTVLALIKLEEWEEAKFWGMRTINMLRDAVGGNDVALEQEVVRGFPAADAMGKIYYRTALVYKEEKDLETAKRLLRVSCLYLPNDQVVQTTLQECMPRIG